jgi:alpha-beta hydrolase superfamily lysophospholipase
MQFGFQVALMIPYNFFSKIEAETQHIIIPLKSEKNYQEGIKNYTRNAVYMKQYKSANSNKDLPPLIFFHGGPVVRNQEQFSELVEYFTDTGQTVYIPEIQGSSSYYEGKFPKGFDIVSMIPEGLNLVTPYSGGCSGINEFEKNYLDDIQEVINYVYQVHGKKKINVIAHSLGGHHLFRSLQHDDSLNYLIESIGCIACTFDIGLNRFSISERDSLCTIEMAGQQFNTTLPQAVINTFPDFLSNMVSSFYRRLESSNKRFIKSSVNSHQSGPSITQKYNSSTNSALNQEISVIYNDLSRFPPLFIIHANDDTQVLFEISEQFYTRLKESHSISALFLKNGEHGFIKNDGKKDVRDLVLTKLHEFFLNPFQNTYLSDVTNDNIVRVSKSFEKFLAKGSSYLVARFTAEIKSFPELSAVCFPKDKNEEEALPYFSI